MLAWWRQRQFDKTQERVNNLPDKLRGSISDRYHTFDELYEHRITLYIALCKEFDSNGKHPVWRTKIHSDGSVWKGLFVLGIHLAQGKQITYHLPIEKWNECGFALELRKAPPFDGHTSDDVLKRLRNL